MEILCMSVLQLQYVLLKHLNRLAILVYLCANSNLLFLYLIYIISLK